MRWFSGKEFPRDSPVDAIDGDMFLETLLNDNPTRIRRYPEEFLVLVGLSRMWYASAARPVFYDDDDREMNLQNFIKVPNPFDVVCAEKKLAENEKPLLEQTADVVTQPFDNIVNLGVVPLNQVPSTAAPPPLANNPSLAGASKVGEFIHGITSAAPKRLVAKGKKSGAPKKPLSRKSQLTILPPMYVIGESMVGSSQEAADDLCSSSVGSQQLISKGNFKTSASPITFKLREAARQKEKPVGKMKLPLLAGRQEKEPPGYFWSSSLISS
ncbi:hypothetical protein Tco_1181585 [Tanacetum coccineum]